MSLKSKIQALITAANAKTGETDATLTDAVQTLVDGYGGGITPTGNINITDTNVTDVTNYATATVVDADLVAENIKKDVNILGVVGSFEGGGGGEDPMSGSFTLPAPITRAAGLFRGTTLPESFTLNLPDTCTHIGGEPNGDYSLFRGVLGMKHLQINGNALTNDDGAVRSNSVVLDVTYNAGSTEITLNGDRPFYNCEALKSINAILVCEGIVAGGNTFAWSDNIENIRFKSNQMTRMQMLRWQPNRLTNASIVSLCNALKQGQAATATFTAALKSKLSTIYGTVDNSGSFAVFIETGVPTDITLTDFVTQTKGWTIA